MSDRGVRWIVSHVVCRIGESGTGVSDTGVYDGCVRSVCQIGVGYVNQIRYVRSAVRQVSRIGVSERGVRNVCLRYRVSD